jgi:aminoglycoside 3'-phosphotransferase-3
MAKMRISPELKKLIEKYRCVKDTEGMSPAKVYKLVGENENLYLKMTDSRYKGTTYDVEREKDMMLWLEGKLPVPKVLHFERHDGWSNLLMSEADGVLCSEEYEDEQSPEKIIELYAECIRLFHSIDISDCPYTNSLDSRLAELDYLLNKGM